MLELYSIFQPAQIDQQRFIVINGGLYQQVWTVIWGGVAQYVYSAFDSKPVDGCHSWVRDPSKVPAVSLSKKLYPHLNKQN